MTQAGELVVAGVAVGCLYGLVALGFVVIYKTSGVVNFAQGSLLLAGAYLTYGAHRQLGLGFYPSIAVALVGACGIGLALERLVLRRLQGRPVYAVIMATIGLAIVLDSLVVSVWGPRRLGLGDPWGIGTVRLGGLSVAVTDVVRIAVACAVIPLLFLLYRRTRVGVALRAVASDHEAALAQGIPVGRMVALAWAVSAALATVAGVLLASGSRGLDPTLGSAALVAFPAIVLGGVQSPTGAVLGGVVVGVVEVLTAGYEASLPSWAGTNAHAVTPYVVLVAVLLVRPWGLLGRPEAARL